MSQKQAPKLSPEVTQPVRDMKACRSFLEDIGYIVPLPEKFARKFLDEAAPLALVSHADATHYAVDSGSLVVTLRG